MSTEATPANVGPLEELGALPEARIPDANGVGWFTAGQMRAYAAEQVAAEREWRTRIEKAAADVVRVWASPSWNWSHIGSAADAMNALAACLTPNAGQ